GITSLVSRARAMPALLIRMSIVPNAAIKSANILPTAALLDTSATNGRATPPARSISVATFCADSGLMSLTPTFAPSRANVSPISRPRPEPPPVISTTLSLSFIAPLLLAFLELSLPVQAPRLGAGRLRFRHHALLLIKHAEVGVRQDVFRFIRDIFFRQLDRRIEISLGLVAHRHSVDRIGVLRIDLERLFVQLDRFVELIVGVCVDRFVVQFFFVGHFGPPVNPRAARCGSADFAHIHPLIY